MTKRKALGKKTRFEVFKRDLFTCQYCGATPPKVVLEVDHILSVANGGTNEEENLVTSCFDCNRGKGKNSLDIAPDDLSVKMASRIAKADQLKQYEKFLIKERKDIDKKIDTIESIFINEFDHSFTDTFKASVRRFLSELPMQEVEDAMHSSLHIEAPSNAVKYFCGICWKKIKGEY